MAKQYLGTKLQDLGNYEVLDPTDRILVIKPYDEGIMELSEFLLYVKANLDFSNYLTAKQVNDTFATKADTYSKLAADAKFAFVDKIYTRTQSDARFASRTDTYTKDEAAALFASTGNIYLKDEVYSKEEAVRAFALKSEIPVLPDLSPYSTTVKGDLRWALKTDVYAKTESDVRYPLAVNTYNKSDSDVRFAKAANTFTKDEVEAKFLDINEAYGKSYIDQSIYLKSQVYTKLETDAKFQLKSETYTISDVNNQFAAKSWVYSRGDADLTFATKADTHTKTEVNVLTDSKVNALATNLNDNYYNKSVSDSRYIATGTSYSKVESDTNYPLKAQTLTSLALTPTSLTYTTVAGNSSSLTIPTWNQSTTGNAATATKLQTARTINGVSFDGTANITTPAYSHIYAVENRTIKPNSVPFNTLAAAFSTMGGMTTDTANGSYVDVLALNTWVDTGGGRVNALVFSKNAGQAIYHLTGAAGGNAWSTNKQIAYTDSSITGNAATATRLATPRAITISGAVTSGSVTFDGSANIGLVTTTVDATKLSGIVPDASLSGTYSNVTLNISNGLVYSIKPSSSTMSATAYGLGSTRAVGTTTNAVIVIKTSIPKTVSSVLNLHLKGVSDGEANIVDITLSGRTAGTFNKISLGTKDYDIQKAETADGFHCFIISHSSGRLGASTAFSIVSAHLNFNVSEAYLKNWSIYETTDISNIVNIGQPIDTPVSVAKTQWTNIQSKPTTVAGYGITDSYTKNDIYTKAESDAKYALLTNVYNKTEIDSKISTIDQIINTVTLSATNLVFTRKNNATINLTIPTWNQSTTGNAATATKLATARSLSLTGDGAWSVNFDGTANVTAGFTLTSTGVTTGTYPKVTVDAKGRVTAGGSLIASDIPNIDMSKVVTGILPVTQGGTGASDAAGARANLGLGNVVAYNTGLSAGNIFKMGDATALSTAFNSTATGDKYAGVLETSTTMWTPATWDNVASVNQATGFAKRYTVSGVAEYSTGFGLGLTDGNMYRLYGKRDLTTNVWTQHTAQILDTVNSSSINAQFNTVKLVTPIATTAFPNTYIEPTTGEIKKSNVVFGPLATATLVSLANGGTGASTAAAARDNLGLGNAAALNYLPTPTTLGGNYLLRAGDYGLGQGAPTVSNTDLDIRYSGFAGYSGTQGTRSVINAAYSNDWVWQLRTSSNMDIAQPPEFRYYTNGTTWSAWRRFAVQGIPAAFTTIKTTSAATIASAPNTFIDTDGSIKKSTYTFGSAATKNTGTADGDVMTVGSFGLGTGVPVIVDNTSASTIVSSTGGNTGVYRSDSGATTSFQWMPFLYMHADTGHSVLSVNHLGQGVRAISWTDSTVSTPVIQNLYSDKSTIIYTATTDALPNVYVSAAGTLTRASRTFGSAAERNVMGAGDVMAVGAYGLGANTMANTADTVLPQNLPGGFFKYPNNSANKPTMVSQYDVFGIHVPRSSTGDGGTFWLPYYSSPTKRIVYQAHSDTSSVYHVVYTDQNTPNEDVTINSLTIKNLAGAMSAAPNLYYHTDGKLYSTNEVGLLKSQADTYYAPVNASTLYTPDSRTTGDVKPNAIPITSIGGTFADITKSFGITGAGAYGDVLTLNTFKNSTGGAVNALVAAKQSTDIGLWHARGTFNGTDWTAVKQIAYTDSSITGNAATATALQTARTIALSGAVTGTATTFNGTANITIPTTTVDATKLSGIVPNANLSGIYNGFDVEILSNNIIYTKPSTSTAYTAYGVVNGMINGTGAIVIETKIPSTSSSMNQVHIKALQNSYSGKMCDIVVQWFKTSGRVKNSTGNIDFVIRLALNADGMYCIIIADVANVWDYTHISVPLTLTNYSTSPSFLKNWTISLVTDLSVYTSLSTELPQVDIAIGPKWAAIRETPTTMAGYGITDAYTKSEITSSVSAFSATKLKTARTINGIAFDGTANITVADNTKLPLTGGTLTGNVVVPGILFNKISNPTAAISWYSDASNVWQDYMGMAGAAGQGYNGALTPPAGSLVTGWGRRSVVLNKTGSGWTFESGAPEGTTTNIVAEIHSADGSARFGGSLTTGAGITAGGDITTTGNITADNRINVTRFNSATPYMFFNVAAAQQILTGGVLASSGFVDAALIPTYGIYSKGDIKTAGNFVGTAVTQTDGTNTTQIATTAFVQNTVGGYLSKSVTGGTVALTDAEASNATLYFTGTLTSNLIVTVPNSNKRLWAVWNNTTGAFTLTIKTPSGAGVTVAQGKRNLVYSDGSTIQDAFNDFESIALTGVPTAPTAAVGNNTTQIATTAFVNAEIANDAPTKTGTGASGTWPIAVSGNSATATKLATARSIAISGAAIGTATNFDGSGNISIPVTSLDATKLSGTVPNANINGTYSGFTHILGADNTVFTAYTAGRTVYGLAEFRGGNGTTGAIVFITNFSPSINIMKSIRIRGYLYTTGVVDMIIDGYSWSNGGNVNNSGKICIGTLDFPVRFGQTTDGKLAIILGDVNTLWSYPHISITEALFSQSITDQICTGWTSKLSTDLSEFTNLSAPISDTASRVKPLWTNILNTPTTVAGYGITDTYTKTESDGKYALLGTAATESVISTDKRKILPSNISAGTVSMYFTSKGGLETATANNVYGDFIALNTYNDNTAGSINGLFFQKSTQAIYHYFAPFGSTSAFPTPKQIAYTDSNITGNAATATTLQTARTINGVSFNGSANITVADATKLPTAGGTITGNLTVNGTTTAGVSNSTNFGISSTSGTAGNGISLYGGAVTAAGVLPTYGFSFSAPGTFGTHGSVTATDWAVYLTCAGSSNRGWIFKNASSGTAGNVASISNAGNAQFNGSVYAGGDVTAFSDKRLKENITPIANALSKVKALNGVTYTRNDLEDNELRHIGLIAQDVQAVFPEAVRENSDGYLTLNYMGLVGSLVEAIKELDTKNQSLEARLAKLEEKLS